MSSLRNIELYSSVMQVRNHNRNTVLLDFTFETSGDPPSSITAGIYSVSILKVLAPPVVIIKSCRQRMLKINFYHHITKK